MCLALAGDCTCDERDSEDDDSAFDIVEMASVKKVLDILFPRAPFLSVFLKLFTFHQLLYFLFTSKATHFTQIVRSLILIA